MTIILASIAEDGVAVLFLNLVMRAGLGRMANLVTVTALGETTVDNFASVLETLKVLIFILGPSLALARTRSEPLETIGGKPLSVEIALKIHQGPHGMQLLWDGNDPDLDILLTESLLNVEISGVRLGLDIDLNGLLDLMNLALMGCLEDLLPGFLRRHVRQMRAINETSILAIILSVAYGSSELARHTSPGARDTPLCLQLEQMMLGHTET
jgi:hypothetical protein